MAQIQVSLEGVSVAVENRKIPLDVLKLDAQNPRIGLYKDSQPKATFSDDEIRHAIVNRGPDAYTKLRDSIEINEGIIHAIWISPLQHGQHLVIEGNTRVLIYRELAEKYPANEGWKTIPANVLPLGINDSQINFVRLEAHLRGITPWDAYERGELMQAGALANPVDGAVLLFRGESQEVAESFAKADPYVRNGLVKNWRVREWNTVVGMNAANPVRPSTR